MSPAVTFTGIALAGGAFAADDGPGPDVQARGPEADPTFLAPARSAGRVGGRMASIAFLPPLASAIATWILSLGSGTSRIVCRLFTSARVISRPRSRTFRGPCSMYLIGGKGTDQTT